VTVLVTGGAGYIGAQTVFALRDAGEAVVVLDDLSTGAEAAVPDGVPLARGDIADVGLVARLVAEHGVQEIIHFAARISAPESVVDPLGYYLANTVKSHALLQAALQAGVRRLVFSSTAAVYGLEPPVPAPESAPLAPASPYGASKAMVERMLADAAAAHDFRYVALRYFNVAGADPQARCGQRSPGVSSLVAVAVKAALGLTTGLSVYGTDYPTRDGTGERDYIHVADLADAHLAALRHLRSGGESLTLNCGYGHGFTVREVIDSVRRVCGRELPVTEAPRRAGDPYASVADASEIRRRLAWAPRYDDLDTIVDHALAWERRLAQGR
jgi:UDP-glucose 4-epimerase